MQGEGESESEDRAERGNMDMYLPMDNALLTGRVSELKGRRG